MVHKLVKSNDQGSLTYLRWKEFFEMNFLFLVHQKNCLHSAGVLS